MCKQQAWCYNDKNNYRSNNDSFVVIHKTKELESVKVKRYPDQKTTFEDGEVSLEGLILTEYYIDGTSEIVRPVLIWLRFQIKMLQK